MRLLLVTLCCVLSTAYAAAPSPSQILKAIAQPTVFKPTTTERTATDSGQPIQLWIWGKKYQDGSVTLEVAPGNKKAWLWESGADDLKLSAFGSVKKLVVFDSGMQPVGITRTAYRITGGSLKGNYVQVTNFGGGDINTEVFSRDYMTYWAKGPDAVSGLREIRGYFPLHVYLTERSALCSRPDYKCY